VGEWRGHLGAWGEPRRQLEGADKGRKLELLVVQRPGGTPRSLACQGTQKKALGGKADKFGG